jgi:spoIIIJ-associated protein
MMESHGGAEGTGGLADEVVEFERRLLSMCHLDLAVEAADTGDGLMVSLSGPDRDLMFQDRAQLMEANQSLLNRIFGRRLGDGQRIVLDCEEFRKRKEHELQLIAEKAMEKVRRTGEPHELGNLNPYERRIVHLAVGAFTDVSSVSEGEGFLKRLRIVPGGPKG